MKMKIFDEKLWQPAEAGLFQGRDQKRKEVSGCFSGVQLTPYIDKCQGFLKEFAAKLLKLGEMRKFTSLRA